MQRITPSNNGMAGLLIGGLWSLYNVKIAFLFSAALAAAAATVGFWRFVPLSLRP